MKTTNAPTESEMSLSVDRLRQVGSWVAHHTRPGSRSAAFLVTALTLVAGYLVIVRLQMQMTDILLPGEDWQKSHLGDFRDIVYGPGRYLLDGGNPYDPDTYRAANPGAAEFDLYAPIWLLVSISFGSLPFFSGMLAFECFGVLVLLGFAITVVRVGRFPRPLISMLVLFCYVLIWYPTRVSASGSTLLISVGVLIALGCLRDRPWAAGAGAALALIKPQFGLPLVVLLLCMRGSAVVWRAILILVGSSMPFLVWCIVNAGGVGIFVDSLVRNVAYASSPDAATGLGSPLQTRIDPIGIYARLTGDVPPGLVQILIPILVLGVAGAVLARTRDTPATPAIVVTSTLLAIVHLDYDRGLIIGPALWLAATLLRSSGRTYRAALWPTGALLLIMGHAHSIDNLLIPGADPSVYDAIDTGLLVVAWIGALVAACVVGRRSPVQAAHIDEAWTSLPQWPSR